MLDKKYRSTIAVVIVFFGLLGFVFFFERDKEARIDIEENANIDQEINVVDFPTADVNQLRVKNESEELVFEKNEDTWKLQGDDAFDVNDLQVTTLINDLNDLTALRSVESENTDDFGLTEPRVQFEVKTVTEDSYVLSFGDTTLSGFEFFARLGDSNQIFVVDSILQTKINQLTKEDFKRVVETEEGSEE